MELRVNALEQLEDFQDQIRELRRALELSQVELAYKLGVSPRTVQYWEAGKIIPHPRHRRAVRDFIAAHNESEPTASLAKATAGSDNEGA